MGCRTNRLRSVTAQAPRFAEPVICLITDRRRLIAAGGGGAHWREALSEQLRGAIAGGVDIVQIRERDLAARALTAVVRGCLAAAAGTRTRVVVNDRLDVALAAGADGIHLREGSLSIRQVRGVAPADFLVGQSVHSAASAVLAREADYLIAGHVFDTPSKPGLAPLGCQGLADVVNGAGECPVWAVGGISPSTTAAVRGAGARGVALIGALAPNVPIDEVAITVQQMVTNLRFSFDSPDRQP